MAKKHVIAYWMHDAEQQAVLPLLSSAQVTKSFAIGDIDEADIPKAEAAGLIIEEQQAAPDRKRSAPQRPGVRSFGAEAFRPGLGMTPPQTGPSTPAVPAEVDYYVLDLSGPLLNEQRTTLENAGVTFIEVMADGGYKVRLNAKDVAAVKALPGVVDVNWIEPVSAPVVTRTLGAVRGMTQTARMVTFDIRLHDPKDTAKIVQWLKDRQISIVGTSLRKIRFNALAGAPVLAELAALPEVDGPATEYVEPKLFADAARRILGVDAASAVPASPGLALDGSGETIGFADSGIDTAHPDFAGRIAAAIGRGRPGDPSDPAGHGTHVAGCAAGDGTASGGTVKGVATKAKLFVQSLLDAQGGLAGLPVDLNDLFQEAYDAGVRIHNDSWGNENSNSMYMINAEEVDEFVRAHPDMLIVVAAGNDGQASAPFKSKTGFVDWLSISAPGSCKNAITVGASRSDRTNGPFGGKTWSAWDPGKFPDDPIAAELVSGDPQSLAGFSSRGPTDDRRIKPDVVAPGTEIASTRSKDAPIGNFVGPYVPAPGAPPNDHYAYDSGTSMAAPFVTGCAALVRQYYRQVRNHQPSAALLKATLVNSTVWLTGADAIAPADGTPNYHQGHGRVAMQNAIPNTSRPDLVLEFADDWGPGQGLANTGDNQGYQITVPPGCTELRVCLAYTDSPARGLQNNLNLSVNRGGDARKYTGNASVPDLLTRLDTTNNLEVVRIPNPPPGVYYMQIIASNLLKSPQAFALVVTGNGLSGFASF
jgi:subtilisin family serine protease